MREFIVVMFLILLLVIPFLGIWVFLFFFFQMKQAIRLLFIVLVSSELVFAQEFVTYVDAIDIWWPPTSLAAAIGVPGYASPNK